MATDAGTAYITVEEDTSRLGRKLDRDGPGIFGGLGKKMALGFGAAFAAGIGGAIVGIGKATSAGSDLAETISKANTIFGEGGAAMELWATTAADRIGQSKREALDAAASFGNLFTQLGIGQKEAGGLSKQMVELASDFASFHNADVSEVLEAQTAAFRGEYDSVQRFVPTINAAAVEQRALAMTMKASTKELTDQEKALAVQKLLLEGAGAALGDFSRTADGAANKQRILSAKWENGVARLGSALLPLRTYVLGGLTTAVEGASSVVSNFFAGFSEGKVHEDARGWEATLQRFGVSAKQAASGLKGVFAIFAKGDFIGSASTFGLEEDSPLVEGLFRVRQTVLDVVRSVQENWPRIRATIAEVVSAVVRLVQENWPQIRDTVREVLETVVVVVSGAVDLVMTIWRNFGDQIVAAIRVTWTFVSTLVQSALNVIQGLVKIISGIIHGDWSAAWEGITQIFGAAWDAIIAVLAAALGVIQVAISTGWELVKGIFTGAWDAMLGLVRGAWGGILSTISGAIETVIGWVSSLPGRIAGAAAGMWDGIYEAFRDALNAIIRVWNSLEFRVPGFRAGPVSWGGFTLGVPDVPLLDTGGIVTGPMLAALAMNSRPEAVIPLDQLAAMVRDISATLPASANAEPWQRPSSDRPDVHVEMHQVGDVDPLHLARELAWRL